MAKFDIVGDLNYMMLENRAFSANEDTRDIDALYSKIDELLQSDTDDLICDFQHACEDLGFRRGFKAALLLFSQGMTGVKNIYGSDTLES